jgi:hypothetical protein
MRLLLQDYATIDTSISAEGRDSTFSFSLIPSMSDSIKQQAALAAVQKKASMPIAATPLGTLSIISDPAGAEVLIDDKPVGMTPYSNQSTQAGDYKITLRKKDFNDYSISVSVGRGESRDVTAKLTASIGRLSIQVKPYGSVFVDGSLRQENSDVLSMIDLPAGIHQVKAQHPSYGNWEKAVAVEAGEVAEVVVDFNRFAALTVIALDESGGGLTAGIFVDNRPTEYATPKLLKLRHGRHSIEVRRQGYHTQQQSINLENDVDEPLQFVLKRIE